MLPWYIPPFLQLSIDITCTMCCQLNKYKSQQVGKKRYYIGTTVTYLQLLFTFYKWQGCTQGLKGILLEVEF